MRSFRRMQISRMCGVCASAVVFLCVAACGSSITVMQGKNVTCPTRHPDFPIVGVPLVFADGVVYSATVGREVAALRASDGTMLWQRPVPFAFQWLSVSQGLLLLTVNDAIAAVQVSDGTLRWLAAHGALSPPVVDQGVIYANEGSGGVTALRLSDGHLLWHIMA